MAETQTGQHDGESPTPSRPRPALEKSPDETVKQTFESIIIAFVLAFVFRAYVVEAFVIPTGSMAPTLLGRHARLQCPDCGYSFAMDLPEDAGAVLNYTVEVRCPMTGRPFEVQRGTRARAGDRILVLKYVYTFHEPQRWDVVVFKNPQERSNQTDPTPGPKTNYIKRLIGLPGERIALFEGNVYIQAPGSDELEIARKADRPDVQRAVWQPVYHSRFIPLPQAGQPPFSPPWTPDPASAPAWQVDGRRSYVFDGAAAPRGALHFRWDAPPRPGFPDEEPWSYASGKGVYAYNQQKGPFLAEEEREALRDRRSMVQLPPPWDPEPIEDVRVGATVVPEAEGLVVRLSTTGRLLKAPTGGVAAATLTAELDAKGNARLIAAGEDGVARAVLAESAGSPLPEGKPTRLELWWVDHQASLWRDGERVAVWSLDLPWGQIAQMPMPTRHPDVSVELSGAGATLHHVNLDRDLYYSASPGGSRKRAGVERDSEGVADARNALQLVEDEFFCIGDNGPMSADGRVWDDVYPWIEQTMFEGDGRDHAGIVPRRLMLGRAFFVYYPAPYPIMPRQFGVIPNFGDMRFID